MFAGAPQDNSNSDLVKQVDAKVKPDRFVQDSKAYKHRYHYPYKDYTIPQDQDEITDNIQHKHDEQINNNKMHTHKHRSNNLKNENKLVNKINSNEDLHEKAEIESINHKLHKNKKRHHRKHRIHKNPNSKITNGSSIESLVNKKIEDKLT